MFILNALIMNNQYKPWWLPVYVFKNKMFFYVSKAKDWASALVKILRHTAPEDPERAIFIVPRGNEPGRASRVTGSWPGEI